MIRLEDTDLCPVCRHGHLGKHVEDIDFHQWTDKGLMRCGATIRVSACNSCGFRSWGEEAEAIMREALRRAYEASP
ncbi:MAG TPA: hypothetical protein VN668_00835 [Stellaceae bacterium]|nr:hypothetical protein [Stellaceae bacterium]